ncbi:MAG: DUF1801 domain-containing protein [Pseudomonadota bacterium]
MTKTTTRSSTTGSAKKLTQKAPARSGAVTSKKVGKKVAKRTSAAAEKTSGGSASKNIDKRIEELGDWRGETLARLRKLIHEADPQIQEEWKWMGTPCWYHEGGVCTGETYKQVVKLTFFRGAALADPKQLFNSSLEGNVRRAIDFREGERVNEAAFKALIRAAVAANITALASRKKK